MLQYFEAGRDLCITENREQRECVATKPKEKGLGSRKKALVISFK
jgi:hypothetical protein